MNFNIDIAEFSKKFNENYRFLYDNGDENVAGYYEAKAEFDAFIRNPSQAKFVGEFAAYRQDFIASDREAAAFMMTLSDFL